ncbi:MAG: hydroxymethylbilane synthase [Desulfarculaceae bacterium]
MTRIVIATRGSKLAVAQARWVGARLAENNPGLQVDYLTIKTKGDKILDAPLAKVGGKGLFVKEIEDALLGRQADLAVHSMKDVPAELPPGLIMSAICSREDPRDVLVTKSGGSLDKLPQGGRVGTSSLRRQAQLLSLRPDLTMVSIRGNVETRLRKLEEENLDGVVLAAAGLARLGIEDSRATALEPSTLLPAVGQGALGVEVRADDQAVGELTRGLNHAASAVAVAAERAFLARLQGGCQVPIAGFAQVENQEVVMQGLVANLDGSQVVRGQGRVLQAEAEVMGRAVAEEVLDRGGREILAQIYGEAPA